MTLKRVKVLKNSRIDTVIVVAQDWQGDGTVWHYWVITNNNKQ